MILKRKKNTLYCFTPEVMLATVIIELGLAVYTLLRYRQGLFGKVATFMLLLLAMFQVAEYQICSNADAIFWSRFGFVVITLLPGLGLYLVSLISQKQHFLRIGYIAVISFTLLFILGPKSITSSFCGGNYIIFSGPAQLYEFYAAYYFGFLILGIWESLEALKESKHQAIRQILKWIIIGYLSFMLPMGIAYALFVPARQALASIMCGFAVFFALILAFKIVPSYYKHLQP